MTDQPILLYDGNCGVCHWLVRLVLKNERARRIMFAPLQSTAGRELLGRWGVAETVDSVVLIDRGAALTRSDAVVRLAGDLDWPWRLLAAGVVVPRPVRDWLYDLAARRRRPVADRLGLACTVPTLAERERFLESRPITTKQGMA